MIPGYIFAADSLGLSSFNFFVAGSEIHICNATKRIIVVQGQFRVIPRSLILLPIESAYATSIIIIIIIIIRIRIRIRIRIIILSLIKQIKDLLVINSNLGPILMSLILIHFVCNSDVVCLSKYLCVYRMVVSLLSIF